MRKPDMDSHAKKLFPYIEQMTEQQVRDLMASAEKKRDFDVVEALEEELERRGVILDG